MRYALLPFLILVSCAPKTYTTPEIGMPFGSFVTLCNVQGEIATATSVTNSQNTTLTLNLTDTPDTYPPNLPKRGLECVGKFIFVDGKLESITR